MQRAPVLVREDLDELRPILVPALENALRLRAAGMARVVLDQAFHDHLVRLTAVPQRARELRLLLGLGQQRFHRDHGRVAVFRKFSLYIKYIGDTARHARGEVTPGAPQHHDGAAGHVLAAVVADAFHDRLRAGVANREALARDAPEISFATDRAVKHDVTRDDVLGRLAAEFGRGLHRDAPARESLAAVVVGVADVVQRDAFREERAEALPG